MWGWFKKAMEKRRVAQDDSYYARPRQPVTTDEELNELSSQLGLDPPQTEHGKGDADEP